ncbi:MAG: hypothetical protein KJ645_06135 [Planctomycetes bacterium]|nr:hypothetical protein [Planctomycetota bacterium]
MKKIKQKILAGCALFVLWGSMAFSQTPEEPGLDYKREDSGITLHAENIELSKLLRLLSIRERENIITSGTISGTVCVNLFGVTLDQALEAILQPNGYGFHKRDGVYLVMKSKELSDYLSPPAAIRVRLFRLNYLNLDEAQKYIAPFLSEVGQVVVGEKGTTGLTSGETDSGGEESALSNVVLVKDYVTVLDRIAEAMKALDVRPRQVLLEATIIEVFLDDRCKLGVDFTALGGLDFTDLNATSDLFSVDLQDASGAQLSDTLLGARTKGFTDSNPADGFNFGILHDEVGLFIEAIESVVDTNVIANPKVIALNRQKAEIIIGGRLGYYGAATVSDGISQQAVEFLDTGTQLRFRPFISEDGYVRIEVHPERSSGIIDPATGLPSESTSELTTNIMVRDGDTIVIGGLIEEKDSQAEKRVPFLSSIPLLGALFRTTENQTERTEIIVMITPHILNPEDGDGEAESLLEDYEQRKRLFRDGFVACSRTIYAQRHAEKAEACLQEGSLHWAKYHIERAVDLNLHYPPVLDLKRRIDQALAKGKLSQEPMEAYLKEVLQ